MLKSHLNCFLVLSLSIATISSAAFAAENNLNHLKDGVYDTSNAGLCAYSVINDLKNDSIVLAGISRQGKHCSNTSSVEAEQTSPNEYTYYDSSQNAVVSEQTIKACTPQAGNPTPCDNWLYSKRGSLLIRVGDIATSARVVDLYDSNAFRTSVHRRMMRAGHIIADKEADEYTGDYELTPGCSSATETVDRTAKQ